MAKFTTGLGRTLGTVLILEDESLLSLMLEDMVRDMGADDVHVVYDLAGARDKALETDFDCAILDVWIRGQSSASVADILQDRDIPFIFSSGAGIEALDPRHRHYPLLGKPFSDADLRDCSAL